MPPSDRRPSAAYPYNGINGGLAGDIPISGSKVSGHGKPQSWPDKCGNCGAHWSMIGFDYADGFNCRKCGVSDADE